MLLFFEESQGRLILLFLEFLETNMGMVEDNLRQVGNNLEEAWGSFVEEYFNGDDTAALQVIFPILNITPITIPIFEILSKVAVGAILLLISLSYWVYHCLAGNTIQCKHFLLFQVFSQETQETSTSTSSSTWDTFHKLQTSTMCSDSSQ